MSSICCNSTCHIESCFIHKTENFLLYSYRLEEVIIYRSSRCPCVVCVWQLFLLLLLLWNRLLSNFVTNLGWSSHMFVQTIIILSFKLILSIISTFSCAFLWTASYLEQVTNLCSNLVFKYPGWFSTKIFQITAILWFQPITLSGPLTIFFSNYGDSITLSDSVIHLYFWWPCLSD